VLLPHLIPGVFFIFLVSNVLKSASGPV